MEKKEIREGDFSRTVQWMLRRQFEVFRSNPDSRFDAESMKRFDMLVKSNSVNPENLREAFSQSKPEILQSFANIRFEKNKDEVLRGVREKWPFKKPYDLVRAIADYLRENLSYDAMTLALPIPEKAIFQAMDFAENGWDSDKERALLFYVAMAPHLMLNPMLSASLDVGEIAQKLLSSESLNQSVDALYSKVDTQGRYGIPDSAFQNLKKKIFSVEREWAVPDVSGDFHKLMDEIVSLPDDEWKKKLLNAFMASPHLLYEYRRWLKNDIPGTVSVELADVLFREKAGVCRDFALMVRLIYDELWSQMFPETKVLVVTDFKKSHTYNLLVEQATTGNGRKIDQYEFDITRYITNSVKPKRPLEVSPNNFSKDPKTTERQIWSYADPENPQQTLG